MDIVVMNIQDNNTLQSTVLVLLLALHNTIHQDMVLLNWILQDSKTQQYMADKLCLNL